MKCKYCGGDVTLDDHFCPHCGRPVDQSLRHQREMKQYETEFEETKQEALEKISEGRTDGTAVGIRLAAIVLLIIGIFAAIIGLDPYSVQERRAARDVKKHFAEYTQEIDTKLENRDYLALDAFIEVHNLSGVDQFREYSMIFTAVDQYVRIYHGLQDLVYSDEDVERLYYVQSLSRNYNDFYETAKGKYYSRIEDTEKTDAAIADMEADLAVMVQRYLGLTKEETDSFKDLSDSRRTVILEQAIDAKLTQKGGTSLSELEETLPEEKDMEMTGGEQLPIDTGLTEGASSQTGSTQGE